MVVVRRKDAARVLQKSQEREAKEAGIRERLMAGELSLDVYGLRSGLAAKGLNYVDHTGE